jgi:hypothetical protein
MAQKKHELKNKHECEREHHEHEQEQEKHEHGHKHEQEQHCKEKNGDFFLSTNFVISPSSMPIVQIKYLPVVGMLLGISSANWHAARNFLH